MAHLVVAEPASRERRDAGLAAVPADGRFNTSIAFVLAVVAWGWGRRIGFGTAFWQSFVLSNCIGYTIHCG